MHPHPRFLSRAALSVFLLVGPRDSAGTAQAPGTSPPAVSRTARVPGLERVPWTTSRMSGSPDPPPLYRVERVFPKLQFKDPVDFEELPGSDRLVLAEQAGKIFSFPQKADCDRPDLLIDLPKSFAGLTAVYGLTFDPQFRENRFIYICYVLKDGTPDGSRVSRFTVSASTPPQVDPGSEKVIITWLAGGHNGGCLKFGPDGFLYISTGDGAGPNPPDPLNTGQDISDLLSSILRIDVHGGGEASRGYRVPSDNPFVNVEGARPEVWAYGLRNPWKMSFDRQSGDLWVADVGWELWELVYRIEKGGNYGWSIVEGRQSIKPDGKHGPTPIHPPIVDHSHAEAASITGGFVYHGHIHPELEGAYLYGDWETRKVWAFRYANGKVAWKKQLLDTTLRVVCFAEKADGEQLILDYQGGIYQLVPNPSGGPRQKFPAKLSETGLFNSTGVLKPDRALIPYSINAEAWADYASSERFVALPGASQIEVTNDKPAFPKDGVLLKNLYLEMERGHPRTARRIESQVLHYDGQKWNAYSYRWNESQTDAELVPSEGADTRLTIADASAPDGRRVQTWHFAARAECLRCHNPWSGPPLAFNGLQLNRLTRYGRSMADQIETLLDLGVLTQRFPDRDRRLSNPSDPLIPVAERARSYLHANCAHCHRENAGGAVNSWMNYELSLDKMSLVRARPTQGAFNLDPAFVVAPGDPFHSVLYYRTSKLGPGRMPHLGSGIVDERGTALLRDWIAGLNDTASASGPNASGSAGNRHSRGMLGDFGRELARPEPERRHLIAQSLTSTSDALALMTALSDRKFSQEVSAKILQAAAATTNLIIRDLFERFLPEAERTRKSAGTLDKLAVLSLRGDAGRGRKIFFENPGIQCARCHRVRGEGADFGPDLSQIGRKYNRAELLENILDPSKVIDPNYIAYTVISKDGQNHAGLLIKKTADEIILKESEREVVHLSAAEVDRVQPQTISAMPEGLLQNLGPKEVADLLEFLASLQ